jgi:hypothetical protein
MPHPPHTPRTAIAALAALAGAALLTLLAAAGQPPAATVDFAPAVRARMHAYGEEEADTLRSAIVAAVARETRRIDLPAGAVISVTVRDLAPTHPTRRQLADEPAMDAARTHYRGGAELVGEVRDANRQLLATVTYRHFAPTLVEGSASLDPWADARLAIDGFAAKLALSLRPGPARGYRRTPTPPAV